MRCFLVSLLRAVLRFGDYAGGARFEYGEQQRQERLTVFSKEIRRISKAGGEI
jgi:hypothetical protein